MPQQRRPIIPRHVRAMRRDIVAVARGKWNGGDRVKLEMAGKRGEFGPDRLKYPLAVAHQVDLVHRQHDVPDAEHGADKGVAPGLHLDAAPGVHQQYRHVRPGRAGDHVAGILLVAGGVRDDEFAHPRGHEAVGDVDGDALLALRLQPVHQQREIDIVAGGAEFLAILLQRDKLVVRDRMGVVEQPPDQRRFAIIHTPACQHPQQRPLGEGQVGFDQRRHQKYPSRFFFSMAPDSSWSISRPLRSEVRAASISSTILPSVSASLSTAAVSG